MPLFFGRALLFFVCLFGSSSWALGSGHVSLEALEFVDSEPSPVSQNEERLEIEYDRNLRFNRSWSFHFHPFLQQTTAIHAWQTPTFIDLHDFNIEFKKRWIFFRVGFLTLHWEGTDGLNPMDIATMKNLGDPLHPLTKSSAGVQIGHSASHYDFEAEWIPQQTPSDLPGNASAWWPRRIDLPLRSQNVQLLLPQNVQYQVLSRQQYDHALSSNYAARFKLHGDWGDGALAYFEGAADTPILHPIGNVNSNNVISSQIFQLSNPIQIQPIDYRRRTTAASLSTTWGSWIFRVASRHDQPLGTDSSLPGWSWQTVGGVERSFDIASDTVTVILQGAWVHHSNDANLISINDLYDRAVLLGLRIPIGESWTVLVSGFRSPAGHSVYSEVHISHQFNDNWNGEIFGQYLNGSDTSLLGILRNNDRVGTQLTRAF
jgi:hypothetical protein